MCHKKNLLRISPHFFFFKFIHSYSLLTVSLPGLAVMQATHLTSSALFTTIQVSQSHEPSLFLNLSPNPMTAGSALAAESEEGMVSEGLRPVPGLAVSHATHFVASGLLETRHVSHSQVPAGLANMVPNPVVVVVVDVEDALLLLLLSSPVEAAVLMSRGLVGGDCGLAAEQQTHLLSAGLFCTKQTSQLHPAGALNRPENPVEEEVVVVVAAAALDDENEKEGAAVFCCVSELAEV